MEKIKKFCKGFAFSFLLFILYYLVCPQVFATIFRNGLLSENYWLQNLSYLTVYLLTLAVILFIIRKDIITQFKNFLKEPKKVLSKGFTYWIYGMIVMMISNLIITSIVENIAVNEQATRETLFSSTLYAIPLIIFIGPFLEEIIFRYGFRKAFTKKIPYALFCGVTFGALHVITAIDEWTFMGIFSHISEFLFLIPYGSLGYFFAKAYYETENIFSSIIPHMLHNSLSVLLIFLTHFLQIM